MNFEPKTPINPIDQYPHGLKSNTGKFSIDVEGRKLDGTGWRSSLFLSGPKLLSIAQAVQSQEWLDYEKSTEYEPQISLMIEGVKPRCRKVERHYFKISRIAALAYAEIELGT